MYERTRTSEGRSSIAPHGQVFPQELQRVPQLLADNDCSASMIKQEIALKMQLHQMKPRWTDDTQPPGKELSIFYESQMTTAYKKEEKIIWDIFTKKTANPCDTIRLMIYYRSPKITSLVTKNNLSQGQSLMKMTNVMYQIRCRVTWGKTPRRGKTPHDDISELTLFWGNFFCSN